MKYKKTLSVIVLVMVASILLGQPVRTLQYHPDGRDIVCHNGNNRYTRAPCRNKRPSNLRHLS